MARFEELSSFTHIEIYTKTASSAVPVFVPKSRSLARCSKENS